jgi:hypothetical protein
MAALFTMIKRLLKRSSPSASGFQGLTQEQIEEEQLPAFSAEYYYPVNLGEILASRYQVIGKRGYGTTSSVWLAKDLQ